MRKLATLATFVLSCNTVAQDINGTPLLWDPECVSVAVPPVVSFRGIQYDEIPDVVAPSMRLANVLISSGCRDEAQSLIDAQLADDPADRDALYVLARLNWVRYGTATAEELIDRIIAAYPNFTSAHVLLAGIQIAQGRYDEASTILDEVESVSQSDIWIYLDRLRIAVATTPNDEVRTTLLEILETSEFPPNVRITAANTLHRAKDVTLEQFEATYRIPLDIDSGLSLDCKLSNYAIWLMESQNRFEDARELLESYQTHNSECTPLIRSRSLLGYAYLVAAADAAPYLAPSNSPFLARADELLEGNYIELASWLEGRPQEGRLRPFILPKLDVDAVDERGVTKICKAIQQFNVESVRAELDRGANPNGLCDNEKLADYIRLIATQRYVRERQEMLRLLLEYGATVGDVSGCADPSNGDCGSVLLPIFQAYGFGR